MKNKENDFLPKLLIFLLIIFAIFISFYIGVKVGRNNFYYRYPAFIHPMMRPKEGFIPRKFYGHGLVGEVDSIGKDSFVVKSRWGEILTIIVDKDTQFLIGRNQVKFSDLKKGSVVMIIGEPNSSRLEIKASIIRIF